LVWSLPYLVLGGLSASDGIDCHRTAVSFVIILMTLGVLLSLFQEPLQPAGAKRERA